MSNEQRQERLLESMYEEAQAALDDHRRKFQMVIPKKDGSSEILTILPSPSDRAKLSTSFGILFDKIQLSTGGATSRNEEVGADGIAAMLVGAKTAFDIQEEKTAASQ